MNSHDSLPHRLIGEGRKTCEKKSGQTAGRPKDARPQARQIETALLAGDLKNDLAIASRETGYTGLTQINRLLNETSGINRLEIE